MDDHPMNDQPMNDQPTGALPMGALLMGALPTGTFTTGTFATGTFATGTFNAESVSTYNEDGGNRRAHMTDYQMRAIEDEKVRVEQQRVNAPAIQKRIKALDACRGALIDDFFNPLFLTLLSKTKNPGEKEVYAYYLRVIHYMGAYAQGMAQRLEKEPLTEDEIAHAKTRMYEYLDGDFDDES